MVQTQAHINLAALRHNVEVVKKASPVAKVLAVVKANAYGHGLAKLAQALDCQQLIDGFAVARLSEAVALREQGIQLKILVLTGFTTGKEIQTAANQQIDLVLHTEPQLEMLERTNLQRPLSIWLKINTGMNRLGIEADQLGYFLNRLDHLEKVRKPVRLMTHLACADEPENTATEQQIEQFDKAVNSLNSELSIANSAGLLGWAHAQRHWVRPGIMLYGASPFNGVSAKECDLKPVMTLKSHVLSIRHVKKGDGVGYAGSWKAAKSTRVATIGIGYGDGYPRHAIEGTPVLIGSEKATLIGRVSMDSITVDISDCRQVSLADEVTLWGDGLAVEEIARCSGAISYQLLCGVSSRVPRIYQE